MYSRRHKNKTDGNCQRHTLYEKTYRVKWAGLRTHTYTVLNVVRGRSNIILKKYTQIKTNFIFFYLNKSYI